MYSTLEATIFLNANNGANLFAIYPKKSSSNNFAEFCDTLKSKIEAIRYPEGMTQEQKNNIYVKHLEYLLRESVLTNEEFSAAVDRLKSVRDKADIFKLV